MTKIIKSDGPIKRIEVTEPHEIDASGIEESYTGPEESDFVKLGKATDNLKNEIIKALRLDKMVDWLAKRFN